MRLLSIIMILLPVITNAQDLGNLVHAPMSIDLDKDTTYLFQLNKDYCEKDDYNLFGVNENGSFSYNTEMPYLYITHNFSLGCCTSDFYQIQVQGDNLYISVSDTGEQCTCGLCTYDVCFYDSNPQKESYHLHMNCLDTIVSRPTAINTTNELNDEISWNFDNSKLNVQMNRYKGGQIHLKIYNYSGQIIYNQLQSSNMLNIDLPNSDRFFIMNIEYEGRIHNYKIIKK